MNLQSQSFSETEDGETWYDYETYTIVNNTLKLTISGDKEEITISLTNIIR